MTAGFDPRYGLCLAKQEGTEGTNSTPVVGTNDIFKTSITWDQGITFANVAPESPWGGELAKVLTKRAPKATLTIPLYGKGLSAGTITLPAYATAILATCGVLDSTAGAGVSTWTPDPVYPRIIAFGGAVTAQNKSFTLYDYAGLDGSQAAGAKTLRYMTGCKVAKATFDFSVNALATLTLDVIGRYAATTRVTTDLSGANLNGVLSDFITPNALVTTLSDGSTPMTCHMSKMSLSVDFMGAHVAGDDNTSGVATVQLGDVMASGSMNPILSSDATLFAMVVAAAENVTPLALSSTANGVFPISRSGGTGYGVRPVAAQVQPTGNFDMSDKLMRYAFELNPTRATLSGAPFSITFI